MTLVVAKASTASQRFQTSKQIDGSLNVQCQLSLKDCCKAARASCIAVTATAQQYEVYQKVAQTWTLGSAWNWSMDTMEAMNAHQKACVYFINSHSSCVLHDWNSMRCLAGFY